MASTHDTEEAAAAAADTYDASTALASAQKSGLASNAFGIRDAHGITLLSLPPEGE